jgi:hypothetical protein
MRAGVFAETRRSELMARKKKANDPAWVCVNSLHHNGATFRHGDTYRASETEDVRRDEPESFIPWPALPDEIRRANAAIMRETLEPQPEPEPTPKRARRVRARRSMMLRGAVLPMGRARGDAVTLVNKGDELPESHPAVRARPKDFEPVS